MGGPRRGDTTGGADEAQLASLLAEPCAGDRASMELAVLRRDPSNLPWPRVLLQPERRLHQPQAFLQVPAMLFAGWESVRQDMADQARRGHHLLPGRRVLFLEHARHGQ